MLSQARLDERFLDRGGCGDELYADAHQRASMWLARIHGVQSLGGDTFDMGGDFGSDTGNDASFDDSASH